MALVGQLRSAPGGVSIGGISLRVNKYDGKVSVSLDPFAKIFKMELQIEFEGALK